MTLKLPWKKDKLLFPIVRVDDRLLHGQVIVGWASTLDLSPVILASDRVAKDANLARTFTQLVPPEHEGVVLTLTEAAERWTNGSLKDRKAMIVIESPVDALKLVGMGAPLKMLTLGGMHFRPERVEFVPYIYLSEWDRTTLDELQKKGVKAQCQDLPTSKPIPYEEL